MDDMGLFLTINELAERWKYHPKTIWRKIKQYKDSNGEHGIPAFLAGGEWRIRIDDIEKIENGDQ